MDNLQLNESTKIFQQIKQGCTDITTNVQAAALDITLREIKKPEFKNINKPETTQYLRNAELLALDMLHNIYKLQEMNDES